MKINLANKRLLGNGVYRFLQILFLLSFVSACQLKMPITTEKIQVDDLSYTNLSKQNEATLLAIQKLEIGELQTAQEIIQQVLRANKNHELALFLRKQLSTSSIALFKTSRTTKYTVKAGDSLRSIAKIWLEGPLYFVSLAKLNKIKNPSTIQPGDKLIIPVIQNSPLVKQERRRSRANIELLNTYVVDKKYLKALSRMTSIYVTESHFKELIDLQYNTLNTLAASRISISERHNMIDQVKVISAQSKRKSLDSNFRKFIVIQLHNVLLEEFILLYEDQTYYQAANKLIAAKKLKPIIKQNISVLETESKLVEKLHEKAIILRKDQNLEEAIKTWKLILKIRPKNELATKYLKRTTKLKNRLDNL